MHILEKRSKRREGQYCIQITLSNVKYGQVAENELESPSSSFRGKDPGGCQVKDKINIGKSSPQSPPLQSPALILFSAREGLYHSDNFLNITKPKMY